MGILTSIFVIEVWNYQILELAVLSEYILDYLTVAEVWEQRHVYIVRIMWRIQA
jgi:hypothetical protein